jgi:hypothetical protein
MLPDVESRPSLDVQYRFKIQGVQLELAQYPLLARKMRKLMRQELFEKGIIAPEDFEAEVEAKAIASQQREGVTEREPVGVWNERLTIVRDQLTDFYFAYNIPPPRLEEIVQSVLSGRVPEPELELALTFNPELAPWDLLIARGEEYESLPPEQRDRVQHHLREIIVVLLKRIVSDQLAYVGIAKELFTIQDLKQIWQHRIGHGRIGGKAAGMLLAHKIAQLPPTGDEGEMDVRERVGMPESYYVASDVFYDFITMNGLNQYMNQKYKPRAEIEADFPCVRAAHLEGHFPDEIVAALKALLEEVGDAPLIARSSSLLEDNFGTAFAGKYDSFFCPNQGTPKENLASLMDAIKQVYASALNPDALLYRQHKKLVDYDERMAVLVQKVQGAVYGDYFFPTLAGVGYSRNPFRWNSKIRREDGFLRLVCGLGTRAVDRVANDYPRMIALSHPQLRPEIGAHQVRKYSQRFIDLIDLRNNALKTLPVPDVIGDDYPSLRYLASVDKGDYLASIVSRLDVREAGDLVLTLRGLTQDPQFIALMKTILRRLERHYKWPVDIEFTVDVQPGRSRAGYKVQMIQCRPLVSREGAGDIEIPQKISPQDLIFSACELVPQGVVSRVRYVVYVDPQQYDRAPDQATRLEVARVVGRLNKRLEGQRFILMGPGRWGSSNLDLGVRVTYADIHNARVLVEIPLLRKGCAVEASYGTHFFQDLVEAGIYPLPITPDKNGATLNTDFFASAPNQLTRLSPADGAFEAFVQVVDVPDVSGGRYLEIVMDGEQERAVGYLKG